MNTIARYEQISRECDGILASITKERSRPAQVSQVSVLGNQRTAMRFRVSRLAELEQMLAERQREAARLFDGIAEIERCDSDGFWAQYDTARHDAAALAAYRKAR